MPKAAEENMFFCWNFMIITTQFIQLSDWLKSYLVHFSFVLLVDWFCFERKDLCNNSDIIYHIMGKIMFVNWLKEFYKAKYKRK